MPGAQEALIVMPVWWGTNALPTRYWPILTECRTSRVHLRWSRAVVSWISLWE